MNKLIDNSLNNLGNIRDIEINNTCKESFPCCHQITVTTMVNNNEIRIITDANGEEIWKILNYLGRKDDHFEQYSSECSHRASETVEDDMQDDSENLSLDVLLA